MKKNIRSLTENSLFKALIYGTITYFLYFLLFMFRHDVVEWAHLTRMGHKEYAFIPILIALIFSLAHGSFTAYFWDALGLKASTGSKKKSQKRKGNSDGR